ARGSGRGRARSQRARDGRSGALASDWPRWPTATVERLGARALATERDPGDPPGDPPDLRKRRGPRPLSGQLGPHRGVLLLRSAARAERLLGVMNVPAVDVRAHRSRPNAARCMARPAMHRAAIDSCDLFNATAHCALAVHAFTV